MRRRLNRTTRQYIMVSVLSAVIIGGAFILVYFTMIRHMKLDYVNEIHLLEEQLKSREVYVYQAKSDIPAGTMINEDNLSYVKSYSNQAQSYFMTKKDIGKIALIKIDAGTQLLKGMLTDNQIDDNLREAEYNTFLINSNVKENEYIDVRLQFPNGEDYIVLSKKSIKNVNLEANNCFLWLSEEEILSMSAAMVDAYLYTGSKLYMTKYIEPNLQEASLPTYEPGLSTLTLMEKDKNIVKKASTKLRKILRKELESRLADYINGDITRTDWKVIGQDSNAELGSDAEEDRNTESGSNIGQSSNSDQGSSGKDSVEDSYFIDFETEDSLQETEAVIEYGG